MQISETVALTLVVVALAGALGCSAREDTASSSEAATSTTLLLKPTGGLGYVNTSTVGCPSDDEWLCVTDGTSLAASDGDKTTIDSTAAGGRQGQAYSGAPAGAVTHVTTNVVAAAESGAAGTVTVALYSAGKLLATGAPHALTGTYAAYSDSFSVSVASANSLQTWVTLSTANLKFTDIWLDVTLSAAASDAGSEAGKDGAASHSVTLSWGASSTPGVTYTVLRTTTSDSGYVSQVKGLAALTWTDTAVQSGATYYYVVDDSLGSENSAYSNQATATIP